MDIITGLHSISEAINNETRSQFRVVATDDGFKELTKRISKKELEEKQVEVELLKPALLQEKAKLEFESLGFNYQRVPSGIFLMTKRREKKDLGELYDRLKGSDVKVIAIDRVTDIHNLGAIVRSAAFYGVDYLLYSRKGADHFPPSFYRIASGGAEHVDMINVSSLPKALNKLSSLGVELIGFSEHAQGDFSAPREKSCLVFGAEDEGLSNAVERILDRRVSLKPLGKIKSLNVSVAVSIGLEKFLGLK